MDQGSGLGPPYRGSTPARNVTFAPTSQIQAASEVDATFSGIDLPDWGDSMENVRLLRKQLQVVQDIRGELARKNAVIATLRAENDSLRHQAYAMRQFQEQTQKLESRCANLSAEATGADGARREWEERARALERRLQEADGHIGHLEKELAGKGRALADLEAEAEGLRQSLGAEQRGKEEAQRVSRGVEENLNRLLLMEKKRSAELADEGAALRARLAEAELRVSLLGEVQQQKESLQSDLTKLQEEFSGARAAAADAARAARAESEGLAADLRQVRGRVALMGEDQEALAGLLQAKEEAIARMEGENRRRLGIDEENQKLRSENDSLQKKMSDLLTKLGTADGTLREVRAMVRGGLAGAPAGPSGEGPSRRLARSRSPLRGGGGGGGAEGERSSFASSRVGLAMEEFAALDHAGAVVLDLGDLLQELEGARRRGGEAAGLGRTAQELEQRLHQERVAAEELALKLSILDQRCLTLEEDLRATRQDAESRGAFLENLLHQLRIAGVAGQASAVFSTSAGREDRDRDVLLHVGAGVQELIKVHASSSLMHQKLEDSEALINALRAELSEENSMHQKELRKMEDRAATEVAAFRARYQEQLERAMGVARGVEDAVAGVKQKQREKLHNPPGTQGEIRQISTQMVEQQLKVINQELESQNSTLTLKMHKETQEAQSARHLLEALGRAARLLAQGAAPLAARCRALLGQKAYLEREARAHRALREQLAALVAALPAPSSRGGGEGATMGDLEATRYVETLLLEESTQPPGAAAAAAAGRGGGGVGVGGRGGGEDPLGAAARRRRLPTLRAVVVAVVAAHRLILFSQMAAGRKRYYPRRFPFVLLESGNLDPCATSILDAAPTLDGWLQMIDSFGEQAGVDYPSKEGYGGDLVTALSLGFQRHQRNLWDRGLLSDADFLEAQAQEGGEVALASRPAHPRANRAVWARRARYAPATAALRSGGLALVARLRAHLCGLTRRAADAAALATELGLQLEAATHGEADFKDGLSTERARVAHLRSAVAELEATAGARQEAMEGALRERDRRLRELNRLLKKATEEVTHMRDAKEKVQEELFQLHTYIKSTQAWQDSERQGGGGGAEGGGGGGGGGPRPGPPFAYRRPPRSATRGNGGSRRGDTAAAAAAAAVGFQTDASDIEAASEEHALASSADEEGPWRPGLGSGGLGGGGARGAKRRTPAAAAAGGEGGRRGGGLGALAEAYSLSPPPDLVESSQELEEMDRRLKEQAELAQDISILVHKADRALERNRAGL